MKETQVFKFKFDNFNYHKIKIFTGGAYAPYNTHLVWVRHWWCKSGHYRSLQQQLRQIVQVVP